MEFALHLLISIGHILPTVLGFNLVFGKAKIFHFGPYGVSLAMGYAMYLTLMSSGSFLLALGAGALMGILLSVVFALISLRLEPDAFGVLTLAMHLMVIAIVLNWSSVTRGALGVPGIPRLSFMQSTEMFAVVCTVSALCFFVLFYLIDRSKIGRALEALAEHQWHAQSLGIDRRMLFLVAFLLLGLGHLHGNFFVVQYIHFLHPNDYHFPALIFLVMAVVAGRPGSVVGATVATAGLVLLKEALRFLPIASSYVGPVRLLLFGVILFAAVWWRRDELFPKQRSI